MTALLGVVVVATTMSSAGALPPPWERPLPPRTFDGGHLSLGAPSASTSWYFAEGHTAPNFDEYLVLNNSSPAAASATVMVLGTGASRALGVPAHARATLNVKDILPAGDGGLSVSSSQPVVAERVEYFDYMGLTGGSSTVGVTETARSWTFAEGYTGPGFFTFILLSNPSPSPATAVVAFQRETGQPVETQVTIPPIGRVSINAADVVPGASFTTRVRSDEGIVAERAMYFSYGPSVTGGHVSMGARAAATRWDFAEGYTAGFDTYYLLANPATETASVNVTFRVGQGLTRGVTAWVSPGARFTIRANDLLPPGEAGATVISSVPIVAERAMYFDAGFWNGGTATIGAPNLSPSWLFAEGYTSPDFVTYFLVANPSDSPTSGVLSLRRRDGTGTDLALPLAPRSRATVRVNDLPGFEATELAASVQAGLPVVAERATYFLYSTSYFDPALLGTRVLSLGMSGRDVFEVQRRMVELGLDPGPLDGTFSDTMTQAAVAVEKLNGLPRTGVVGDGERAWLAAGQDPPPRDPSGDHVEIDITHQVALYVRGGKVIGIWPTSTGAADNTPRGVYHVYLKVPDWDCGAVGCLFKPSYFVGGFAIHGYPSVPTYPASHGCARVPMAMADWVYDALPLGFEVFVYD
jgi:cell wall hydrolase